MSLEVIARMPPASNVPGLRAAFHDLAGMRARDVAEGCVSFAPIEAPGALLSYFNAIRLCDATTALTGSTWDPLLAAERFLPDTIAPERFPGGDYRSAMLAYAKRIYDPDRAEAQFASLNSKIVATPNEEIPDFLTREMSAVFEAYPDGSLWLIRSDRLFSGRSTLLRVLATNDALAPDYLEQHVAGQPADVKGLRDQALSKGADVGKLLHPLLLLFSPATLGVVFGWLPHALVFLTGHTGSMIRRYPATPWALYDPGVQSSYVSHSRYGDFIVDVPSATIEALLQWWIHRLNVAYTHLLDPTRFADDIGWHQPRRQLGHLLTFERVLADQILIHMHFAGPELVRQQSAFDLLDKAESLLGFDTSSTGRGFERMLRRASMVERLDEVWQNLPVQIRSRFQTWTRALYDALYADLREHNYPHRLTANGVRVWSDALGGTTDMDLETFVAKLLRAQRNSAHGFIHVLTSTQRQARTDRSVLGGHDGQIPPTFADLAALLAFALVADFEGVVEGSWLPRRR